MRAVDIKVGKSYENKTGRAVRKVLEISDDIKPFWAGYGNPPDEPGVRYEQERGPHAGREGKLYLSAFARWAREEA